jgi:hypothetical protein
MNKEKNSKKRERKKLGVEWVWGLNSELCA